VEIYAILETDYTLAGKETFVNRLTRRDFLRLAAAGVPSLVIAPGFLSKLPELPLGRVAIKSVDVRLEPDPAAPSLLQIPKDSLVQIVRFVDAKAPSGNPRWLQVDAGFVHSGDIQPVEFHPQAPFHAVPQTTPAEVCVPITQSYRSISPQEEILYRLYYKSVHWVTGTKIGDRGKVWYILHDQQLNLDVFAPAEHLRLLGPENYSPFPSTIDPWKKWIDIRISDQSLTAYEDAAVVRTAKISSGMAGKDTATPTGTFNIQIKVAAVRMGDGRITADPLAYELPGVPWVSYFELDHGVALHGTYWHNDFGRRRSHGCINLAPDDALWFYRWTTPSSAEAKIKGISGLGTRVIVR
jgi:hypothetical protein